VTGPFVAAHQRQLWSAAAFGIGAELARQIMDAASVGRVAVWSGVRP